MLSKLSGFVCNNVFFVSRQKTLLKKRKTTSKKQKVAKKKFLEHNPSGSYTNELKILQIQKQLDRKVSKNHHLNELMDELFYPDVRYANQKAMQQNLLKISINPEENLKNQKGTNNQGQYQTEQKNEEFDELVQQIYLCQIPSQLFQLYLKNSQFFDQHYLTIFFQRLAFYFQNKQIIEQRVTQKWKQSLQKLKLTDTQKKKRKRCPYIFIQRQELIRDEDWNKVIKDINRKIIISTQHIQNQKQDENSQQQQLEQIDQSFYSLENNCDLGLQIKRSVNYVPEQIFDSIIKKAFAILKLNKMEQTQQERLPIFSHSQKVKLLMVLNLKGNTKSTLTKSLHIESPEQSQKQQQRIVSLGKKICEDILKSPKCSADDLGIIISSQKGQHKILDSILLSLAKPRMLQFLSKTNLQRSIDYVSAFYSNGTTKDSDVIEVLLFDIYRKLPYTASKQHLFDLISIIRNLRIAFGGGQISISVSQIFPRISETIAKYLNQNLLSHEEVKTYLNSIYQNYPLYLTDSRSNILEMATTAIVKVGQGFKLEEITQLLFKITLMGHRSKIFSKYVFQRYLKQYKNLMKQYKSQKIQLISDKSSNNQPQQEQIGQVLSMNEILLEQSLMMVLWCYVINLNSQNVSLPLDDMIEVYPLYIYSQDQMIQDLKEDLNFHLRDYNFFPVIKNRSIEVKSKDNKQVPIKSIPQVIRTDTFQRYRYNYSEATANQILLRLEQSKQMITNQVFEDLVFYLMRYSLIQEHKIENIRVLQRWNDGVRSIYSHRSKAYENMWEEFLKLNKQNSKTQTGNISSRLIKILQNRHTTITSPGGKPLQQTQKGYKLYELL